MQNSKWLLLLGILGCVACGTPSPRATEVDGGSAEGGPATDAGNPSEDEGPLWDGKLHGAPKLVAKDVRRAAMPDDDHVVYATASGVMVADLETGKATSVVLGTNYDVSRAGNSVIASAAGANATGWSTSTGPRSLSGITLGADQWLDAYPNTSGNRVVITRKKLNAQDTSERTSWVLDVPAMAATALPVPTSGSISACTPWGEAIVCSVKRDDNQMDIVVVDGTGLHVRATINDQELDREPMVSGDNVFVSGPNGVYRMRLTTTESPSTLSSGPTFAGAVVPLRDGWFVIATQSSTTLVRADGSDTRKVAAVDGFIPSEFRGRDTSKNRWFPICDGRGVGMMKNLRLVDSQTGIIVKLSDTCAFRALTYSDNFAFILDSWVATPHDPVLEGTGVPTVVDRRDESKHTDVVPGKAFRDTARPIGKNRLLFERLAFGVYRNVCFYDGHSAPGTPCAALDGPLAQVNGIIVLKNGTGGVAYARNDSGETTEDLYLVKW